MSGTINNGENKAKKSLIFLTGFMGSGKSTVGPILANVLGYEYIDIDALIEKKANKKIVDIFRTEGEQAFRAMERNVLRELVHFDNCVISLGGGTIANEENCKLVINNGILVYLKLSPDEIIKRVQDKDDRPMLKDEYGNPLPPPKLRERINQLLDFREQYYSRADIIVPTENVQVGKTVDEIVKRLREIMKKS